MQKSIGIGILLAFLSHLQIKAQESEKQDTSVVEEAGAVGLIEDLIDLVSFEKGRHGLVFYPMAGYSPRQGFHIGVMPVWRIKPNANIDCEYYRPTTIAPSVKFSTTGMYEVELDVNAYTKNRWMFISKFQYLYLPDEFYGIGNEVKVPPFSQFEINRFKIKSEILKGLNAKWFVGVSIDINNDNLTNIEGDVLTPDVMGYHGGWANGLGPGFAFDSRNDQLYPSRGWFVLFATSYYSNALGSDYEFFTSTLDIRKYIPLQGSKSILALQTYMSGAEGDVPFYKLSFLGGSRLLRGISHPYRYMDKHVWYAQSEWRKHIWWRLGGVLFTGAGKVSPAFMQAPLKDLHVVMGGGLRFKVLPDEGLNFRVDFGRSNHGDTGVYFTIREAF
ncbi:BamA/TamA family outer membrane protein [Carboxylicivirga sp. A043]|uniref:outer membrane protein assembly factor n=1 Tax=Carboxylicivirga litoralis TaxID=2816963 RepID=UPI0021CB5852|nr:outer membrane protein assembly factor [Carboxylicivirga sp. A043]MCU4154511.1 BamA/TamA family outer membrane protein [Carboxylicivirga sp. A043]